MAIPTTKIISKNQLVLNQEELPAIWVETIDFEIAQFFTKEIIRLDSDPEISDIFVYISSYGGGAHPVLSMIEAMLNCQKPVHTIGLGLCASAGGCLLSAGTGTRYLSKNSLLHFHNLQVNGEGDLSNLERDLLLYKQLQKKLFSIVLRKSKLDVQKLEEKIEAHKGEWILSATQAKQYGLIDKIGMPRLTRSIINEVEW